MYFVGFPGGTSSKELASRCIDMRGIFIYLLALFFILKLVFKDLV